MTRRFAVVLALALAAFAIGPAATAADPEKPASIKGKIVSIDGIKVEIELVGEKADWVKKGAAVKFAAGAGKIVELAEARLVFTSRKASELKVGDELVLEKGRAVPAGC
jgi:hypothetical protein